MSDPNGVWIRLLSTDLHSLLAVLGLHALVCGASASVALALQPRRFHRPRWAVWMLYFQFSFLVPVVGAIGLLFVIRSTLKREAAAVHHAVPVSVALPQYDVQSKENTRSGQGAIRSRLGNNVPSEVRMQSLMTLQAVPNRVSNPILEDLLGDSTDDVRLVAFGMLDAEEKRLTSHIQQERKHLEQAQSPEQRGTSLRHLAELHWELIYASLAQGELRNHILGQARSYLDDALAAGLEPDSGMLFLRGRILLAQGEVENARTALEESLALGQPLTSALPYLAEIAFKQRDFAHVQQSMQQLVDLNVAARTRAVADFWTGRDNVSNFSDRQYLPHI